VTASGGTLAERVEARLPGHEPASPPWGSRTVGDAPDLRRRLPAEPADADVLAVVLGAGGSFGPDVVRALSYRRVAAVVGADVQLTYRVPGAVYRAVDLANPDAVRGFVADVWDVAAALGLRPSLVMDLATVQTTPTTDVDRGGLEVGKRALVEALTGAPGDVTLFHMSTAEVYGAPPGAPYRENHPKAPFNAYGREKLAEEQAVLAGDGRPTRGGTLRVVALRSWTICMVETDADGRVVEARNYNDPIVYVSQRLARAGVRVPVVDPALRGTFHLGEEVAEVAVVLATEPADSPVWGRAFNVTGRARGDPRRALRGVHRVRAAGGPSLVVRPGASRSAVGTAAAAAAHRPGGRPRARRRGDGCPRHGGPVAVPLPLHRPRCQRAAAGRRPSAERPAGRQHARGDPAAVPGVPRRRVGCGQPAPIRPVLTAPWGHGGPGGCAG
jgi:hypothetical protein